MAAKAEVIISARTDSKLKRHLKGVVRDSAKAETQIKRHSIRSTRAAFRLKVNESKGYVKASQRDAKTLQQIAKQTERVRIRSAQRAHRAEKQALQKTVRAAKAAAQQAKNNRRGLAAGAAGAAIGAATGVAALGARAQGAAGVDSLEGRLKTGTTFRKDLIRKSNEAKITDEERVALEAKMVAASKDTNISLTELMAGMGQAQTRFDKFSQFGNNIGAIASAAHATGESVSDMVGVLGTATNVLQLDEAGQREFLDLLVSTSQRGAIGVGDFATTLAPVLGSFAIATAGKDQIKEGGGIDIAREFFAVAQTVGGASQAGASETATMVQRIVSELQKTDVQKKLRKKAGIEVLKEDGTLKSIGEVARLLSTSAKFNDPRKGAALQSEIFREIRGKKGILFMANAITNSQDADGGNTFTKLRDIKAGEGDAFIDKTNKQLKAEAGFDLEAIGIKAQAATLADQERIIKKITPGIEKMTELQLEFPLLTEGMSTLTQTIQWAVGAIIAQKALTGAGAAANLATGAGGLGAGAAGAGLTTGVGALAAGGAAGVATLVGGALAAGAVGYLGASALWGDDIFKWAASQDNEGPSTLAGTRALQLKEKSGKIQEVQVVNAKEVGEAAASKSEVKVKLQSGGAVQSTSLSSSPGGPNVSLDMSGGMSSPDMP
ncbi:MAG: phage tail tape measure protein [Myxococcales bacterium]|nr:phage tail tape measure protein [Myxococcales bacterium]